ncbi:hypothetical protein HS99_0003135 [Kitasatospora aureofaciens]|uniref:Uncharacterized protein n=1 Tax=Kitasatospora aureofaciens TaxID=1894 RepID=A0A1E7NG72_KITAU|nr:hypothetical protein [Kitasatospora aureofaciens]OEV39672.1 hypothetical protein HS99_0003135 [Kitasatospora aureofaciens]
MQAGVAVAVGVAGPGDGRVGGGAVVGCVGRGAVGSVGAVCDGVAVVLDAVGRVLPTDGCVGGLAVLGEAVTLVGTLTGPRADGVAVDVDVTVPPEVSGTASPSSWPKAATAVASPTAVRPSAARASRALRRRVVRRRALRGSGAAVGGSATGGSGSCRESASCGRPQPGQESAPLRCRWQSVQ